MKISMTNKYSAFGLKPEILAARPVVFRVLEEMGCNHCVLTAGSNCEHMRGSRHGFGLAEDYDPIEFDAAQMEQAAREIRRRIGHEYDVVAHSSHIHVEWDRK